MLSNPEAVRLLLACRPLAAKLVKVQGLYHYQLSEPELTALKGYERVFEGFNYPHFSDLADCADLNLVERVCLSNLYAIVCLRKLKGVDEATGEQLPDKAKELYHWLQTDYQTYS